METMLNDIVTDVVVTLAVALGLWLVGELVMLARRSRSWLLAIISTKVSNEAANQIDQILDLAVAAAQDARVTGKIEDVGLQALVYAVQVASRELKARGIPMNEDRLEDLIRGRYQQLRGSWGNPFLTPVPPSEENGAQ